MKIIDSETIFSVEQIFLIEEKSYELHFSTIYRKEKIIYKIPHNKYSGFKIFTLITL